MLKTYHGSCHCGAVAFEAEIDLAAGTSKCNCTSCIRTRFWKAIVPTAKFRLIRGEQALADYQFGRQAIHHRFCRHCGVKTFGSATFEPIGPFYAVNITCLTDVSDAELATVPVTFENGREDRWDMAPAEIRYL